MSVAGQRRYRLTTIITFGGLGRVYYIEGFSLAARFGKILCNKLIYWREKEICVKLLSISLLICLCFEL